MILFKITTQNGKTANVLASSFDEAVEMYLANNSGSAVKSVEVIDTEPIS